MKPLRIHTRPIFTGPAYTIHLVGPRQYVAAMEFGATGWGISPTFEFATMAICWAIQHTN